jgi:hypothetical protein
MASAVRSILQAEATSSNSVARSFNKDIAFVRHGGN